MTWLTLFLLINITLALVGLGLLSRKAIRYWSGYQSRTKDFWWVLTTWCVVTILSSIERLIDWGTNFRVFFTLFALVLTIKTLLRPNEIKQPTFTKEF